MFTRIAVLLCALAAGSAQAALHDRGSGLIYDDVLNVTWLQDANYAKTSGASYDGKMLWTQALAWVSNLSYYDSVRNVTYSDWRLPQINPVNGVNYTYGHMTDGTTDEGYNVSASGTMYAGSLGSELAYMFYQNLNNIGRYTVSGIDSGCYVSWPSATCLAETGPFVNVQPYVYWSESASVLHPDADAWVFEMGDGDQGTSNQENWFFPWAVRDGDVAAIPEPETYAMFLAGLGLIAVSVRSNRKAS